MIKTPTEEEKTSTKGANETNCAELEGQYHANLGKDLSFCKSGEIGRHGHVETTNEDQRDTSNSNYLGGNDDDQCLSGFSKE